MNTSQSLTISHWPARLIGVFSAVVFGFFCWLGIVSGSVWTIFFVLLALASILMILIAGKTTMNRQGISYATPLGRFVMDWDEVRAVVIDRGGNTVVFKGEGKQLVLPGFSFWTGRDKQAMLTLMGQELKQRGIKVSQGFAAFAVPRHTRVPRSPVQGTEAAAATASAGAGDVPGSDAAATAGTDAPDGPGPGADLPLEHLDSLRKPAVRLVKNKAGQFSKIGGLPNMPPDWPWPEWQGRPLAFLCQVDLSALPAADSWPGLPQAGCLYFFYDQGQDTWGFDPNDKGSWRVLYAPGAGHDYPERQMPDQLDPQVIYGAKFVTFSLIQTYPDWQDERIEALDFTDEQLEGYESLCSAVFEGQPAHHLFGYPSPVQDNSMDLECQLVSNGLYCGDLSAYGDERTTELAPGRKDWLLLFQLDTDDDTEMMWGDVGMLYFWIKQDDLQARRFENCWMILQCA